MKSFHKTSCPFLAPSLLLMFFMAFIQQGASAQSMGISSSAITPDASSILEMRTTSKGLLLPRMTTTERDAIASPATGLIIYNTTTNKFNFYNGSSWTALFAGTSGVNSITGTTNRISIGGTAADPTIDISASYTGQNSITTLGTIGTGVWNGTLIGNGNGGTGTSTTFTQGSLVFTGASGVYSQNNSKLFWDNTNFRLGIGTTSPNAGIQVGSLNNGGTDNIVIGGAASPGFMLNTLGTDFGTYYSPAANTVAIGFSSTVTVPSLSVFKVNKTGTATFGTSVATDDNIIVQPFTGGSNSFAGTITTADLTAARTYTLPDASGTLATLAGTETLTNKTISGLSNTISNISMSSLTGILGSANGGTGNGFTKFSGPATAEKTFTLPNASASILTDNAAVTAAQGGTGNTSYTTGDLLYASGATTLSKLSGVATGNALISGGTSTAPSWGKIGLTTHVSGTLPIANGGTNSTATPTNGGIVYGDGTSYQVSAAGTTGQVLKSNGAGAPTWADGVNIVTLGSDVVNSNATANTIADVTGLSFPVTAGVMYRFRALIIYTAAATTTGSRWAINGPATPTLLAYTSQYSLTATTITTNNATAYDIPAASNGSSTATTGNIAMVDGIIRPSANGTVTVRFASEIANSAITAKAGSTLTWW